MKERVKVTDEMREKLAEMRAQGINARTVAATLGIAMSTASKMLSRLPKPPAKEKVKSEYTPRAFSPELLEQMYAMHKTGMSSRKIALALQVSPSAVAARIAVLPKDPLAMVRKSQPSGESATRSFAFKKDAMTVMTGKSKITLIDRSTHDDMPVCAASTSGNYTGSELNYRGRQR